MTHVALIGFGEAAQAFATRAGWRALAFDVKGAALSDAYIDAGVQGEMTCAAAMHDAPLVLSLVTADQALAAAEAAAPYLRDGALYADMNSVAPDTKKVASAAVEAAGGRYLDVAVMAPVAPGGRRTPLLVSGPHALAGVTALRAAGFNNISAAEGPVGAASAIKMIRSVMVKGIEALTAECASAAHAAGVLPQVLDSLEASWPGADWTHRFDYNLDRMLVHGTRRAAELEEVCVTLHALGVDPVMTRAAYGRQRTLGGMGLARPLEGLTSKLEHLCDKLPEGTL